MQRNSCLSGRPGRLLSYMLALTLLLAVASRPVWAGSLKLAGQLGGINSAMAVEGDKAYLCEGHNLTILNIKNAESPSVISRTRLPEPGRLIRVRNGMAYIVGYNAFYVMDARAANAPRKLGSCSIRDLSASSYIYKIELNRDRAYLASYYDIVVLDVSRPSAPKRAFTMKTEQQTLLTVSGGLLLSSGWDYTVMSPSISVYSVDDPATITLKGRLAVDGNYSFATLSGKMAYLSGYEYGLLAVDLGNPARPVKKGKISKALEQFYELRVAGDRLCVVAGIMTLLNGETQGDGGAGYRAASGEGYGNGYGGGYGSGYGGGYSGGSSGRAYYVNYQLRVYDVSDPAKPRERGRLALKREAEALELRGEKACLMNRYELNMIDFGDSRRPVLKGAYRQPLHLMNVVADGDKAYGLGYEREFGVVDLRNPAAPAWRGASFLRTAQPARLAVASGRVYIADLEKGLLTYDVTKPDAPKLLSAYAPKDFKPARLAAAGGRVYATDLQRRFRILDLSKPDQPRELGRMLLPTTGSMTIGLRHLGVSGSLACLAALDYKMEPPYPTSNRLFLVDVANPAKPRLVKTIPIPAGMGVSDCVFSGGYVYAALVSRSLENPDRLFILDVRDSANIKEVTSPALAAVQGLESIAVAGARLFAFDVDSGFRVYDIRRPESPKLLGENHQSDYWPRLGIHAQGDYLYAVDEDAGLLVFKYVK